MIRSRAERAIRVTRRPMSFWIFRGHRLTQSILLLVILASLFFRVFPLEMQKRIVNEAIYLRQERLLFLYCGLYIAAVLLASGSKYLINVLQAVLGQRILVELRGELYRHILQLPLQFYRKMQPGTVISAMTAELNVIGLFLGGAVAIPLTAVLSFLVFAGFMFSLSPLLAVLSLLIYPLELVVVPLLQKRYNRYNKKRIKTTRAMSNVVNEAISGIHEVHANAAYRLEEERLAVFVHRLYGQVKKLLMVKYAIKLVNNVFQSIGPFILFLVGGYLAINGQFTLGALVAFLSAYEKVYDPWKELLEYYQDYQDAAVRYRQIMNLFDQEIVHPSLPDNRSPYLLDKSIEMCNAGFTVAGGVSLLHGINLKIEPNEQVALVGFSGSGKSTLALLIAQLYDHTQGTVLLGHRDIDTLAKEDICRNLSMIAQHPFIFTGTIRDNLLYAVRAAGDDPARLPTSREVLAAVCNVGLEEDLLRFAFESVLPPERVQRLRDDLLKMRRIVTAELAGQFNRVIEIYDINRFLYYSSLRDNLIFGESLSGHYSIDNLVRDPEFRDLLVRSGIEARLLALGLTIAGNTLDLLGGGSDDGLFFAGTPMLAEELAFYRGLVAGDREEIPASRADADRLLHLALRYIPARHRIAAMAEGLAQAVLEFRRFFLGTVVGFDIAACTRATAELVRYGELTARPEGDAAGDFIAYCPSVYLYGHTLRENIFFGAVKEDLGSHQELLDLALEAFDREGLLEELIDFGLDFEVGSKGDRLSGGQRQKVALARAFLRPAGILIMDEATASLDNASQARVHAYLERRFRGNTTIVAVIHRLDLTASYDRIYVLKAGTIVEQGSYPELMAQKGAFYRLARAQ